MGRVTSLNGKRSGWFRVHTEASAYIFNLNSRMAIRIPGGGLGVHPKSVYDKVSVASLAGDGEWFQVSDFHCVVGDRMWIMRDDSTGGWIVSTVVRKIEKVPPSEVPSTLVRKAVADAKGVT